MSADEDSREFQTHERRSGQPDRRSNWRQATDGWDPLHGLLRALDGLLAEMQTQMDATRHPQRFDESECVYWRDRLLEIVATYRGGGPR